MHLDTDRRPPLLWAPLPLGFSVLLRVLRLKQVPILASNRSTYQLCRSPSPSHKCRFCLPIALPTNSVDLRFPPTNPISFSLGFGFCRS
ncbi:hypothetical protein FRX31_030644 [Thalictrum thalictroides]|uniref:Uncharacterized protein n=1 Tax=Thalictrum thalictroides TaxID=46969 RepID=A0A7J6V6E7_THATH|nr:hypothetical protein FRX31_030644 [Thalictrum thalictroides]